MSLAPIVIPKKAKPFQGREEHRSLGNGGPGTVVRRPVVTDRQRVGVSVAELDEKSLEIPTFLRKRAP